MSDIADRAEERIEEVIADGISKARRAPDLKPTGFCYYCNEAVYTGRLFCCADCRTDWDWEQARKRANQ